MKETDASPAAPVPGAASGFGTDAVPGTVLPELAVETSRSQIIAAALATRDYARVHHDPSVARDGGVPDVFVNILSTNAYVGRFVQEWAGPGAEIKNIAIRLGIPNHAGDTLTLSGQVAAVEGSTVTVEVAGRNARGVHVSGRVDVDLKETADVR